MVADEEAAVGPRGRGHEPVLLAQVCRLAAPAPGRVVVDATFGGGGYARAFLEAGAHVVAFDRDPEAIARGAALQRAYGTDRLQLHHAPFSRMEAVLAAAGIDRVDAVVFDLGVSSFQLDKPGRGFSFQHAGPLDMRMDPEGGMSAADIVNRYDEKRLARLLKTLGEEPAARRIARAIVTARRKAPITTTAELADIIARAIGRRPGQRIHPATRSFQALRIAVNRELSELVAGLGAAERLLAPGGRLVAVAFHSLEDRIVKQFLRARSREVGRRLPHEELAGPLRAPSFRLLLRGVVKPDQEEVARNPRARSARLRAAERLEAPAWPEREGLEPGALPEHG
ncbi:MAG: ribosomal RNA small subunit methyltransferase H [Rhodothalassiaceae bacterium]|nr:MAG: ribosomal RNA small subunit methyltransferase H [Rhodothalassiaceae bacterium]